MLNVIFKSRNYNTQLNQLVLMNWVQNMAGICQLIYEPNLLSLNKTIGFNGVVYFVTCDILNGIKIGFWRSSLESLKKRYTTTYGKNTKILFCRTQNAPKLEKEIHKEFHNHNITNEIFSKDKLEDYLHFIKNTKKLKIYDYDNCTIGEKKMKTEFDLMYKTPTLKSQEIQSLMNNCESDSEIYDETIQHQSEISLLEKLKNQILLKENKIIHQQVEIELKNKIIKLLEDKMTNSQ